MYKELEKQLNEITNSLQRELSQANAIDKDGRAIDMKKFNEIIDAKLAQLYEVLETTEKDGVTTDLYGANIINKHIDRLVLMKKRQTIFPDNEWIQRRDASEEQPVAKKSEKTSAFTNGLHRLSELFRLKRTNTEPTNNR